MRGYPDYCIEDRVVGNHQLISNQKDSSPPIPIGDGHKFGLTRKNTSHQAHPRRESDFLAELGETGVSSKCFEGRVEFDQKPQ
jgi:hypothetical protein